MQKKKTGQASFFSTFHCSHRLDIMCQTARRARREENLVNVIILQGFLTDSELIISVSGGIELKGTVGSRFEVFSVVRRLADETVPIGRDVFHRRTVALVARADRLPERIGAVDGREQLVAALARYLVDSIGKRGFSLMVVVMVRGRSVDCRRWSHRYRGEGFFGHGTASLPSLSNPTERSDEHHDGCAQQASDDAQGDAKSLIRHTTKKIVSSAASDMRSSLVRVTRFRRTGNDGIVGALRVETRLPQRTSTDAVHARTVH